MVDPDAALEYISFATERHRIWERRVAGEPAPWTEDEILRTHKFTNAFRFLDYGSQFVINELMEPDLPWEEYLFRCFLYRHTGSVPAWEYLQLMLGEYPTIENAGDVLEAWREYRGEGVPKNRTPTRKNPQGGTWLAYPRTVFTGAYLVFPQSSERGTDKLESIMALALRLFDGGEILYHWRKAKTQQQRFNALRCNKGVADFMSMQILTDFGYSTEFREDDFVVPGPGAIKGAAALGLPAKDAIEWSRTVVTEPHAYGRPLSRMDHQNLLCEFSKYVRFSRTKTPGKAYTGTHTLRDFTVPPKWRKP